MKHIKFLIPILLLIFSNSCIDRTPQYEADACFRVSGSTQYINEPVYFVNCSMHAIDYEWDFGDGTKSNQRNPEHTYITKGNFQVMLVAYNNTSSNTFRHTVSVQKSISACFTVSESNHVVYEAINFTNCSVNANEFEWNFGDGTSSTQENPSHEYTTAGTYQVTLTAGSSDYNSTYSYTQNITILNTTDLDILVLIDGTEIVVPNADVTLYGNFDDWENLTNPISDILLTNADGTVIFYDLNPVVYFIDAYKDAGAGEYLNTEGATSALNLNEINYYQVFIKYFDDSKNRKKIFRRIKKSSKEEHDRIIKANKYK